MKIRLIFPPFLFVSLATLLLIALSALRFASGDVVHAQAPQTPATPITTAAEEKALLDRTCGACHSQRAKTAGLEPAQRLTLDALDPAHVEKNPERWETVVRKLRAGMMPPAGIPRPRPEVFESAIQYLENELDRNAATNLPAPGLHRLNRTEYTNAIRDLLAIEIDPGKFLPSDDSTRGFDNIAAALGLSPALLEGYTSAAGKISRLAIGDVTTPTQAVYRVPEDTSQDYHIEGMPFRTRGGMIVKHEFPADGDYAIKITPISKGNMGDTNPFGEILGEKLEFLLDGARMKVFDWDKERLREDGTFNFKFPAKAGLHTVVVTFIATNYAPGNDLDQHFLRSTIETGGLPGFKFFPHVGKIRIDGPDNSKGASDTPSRRKIFVCRPTAPAQEAACAKQIIERLARQAFRRPVTPEDTEALMSFYQQGRNEGGKTLSAADAFDHGIELALRRILADPEFVFRKEAEPADVKPGEPYRVTDLELASRLSFFLWSTIPDEELLNLASQNKLREPDVLEKQVRRMLSDDRSNQLVLNFAGQWLQLRALRTQTPVTAEFPDFDDNLRAAMQKETELFVDSIVHEDRSVIDLLDADYTFLNERLAKHYGVPNVYGSYFRRVTLPPEFDMRRGLLGKASLMTVSSQPGRTSAVQRGKTVMQVFLGVEPPSPPPNVPPLKDAGNSVHGGHKPTMREQMEMHRKVEPCASCHKIMDPIGFSLENFDAIGQWRTDDGGSPIDPTGYLVDGTKMDGVAGLRKALLRYSPEFVRVATEKLLIYALGRGTEYYDMPLVRSIVHEAGKNQYRFSSLVLGVVKSPQFQMNEKVQVSENGGTGLRPVAALEPRP
jgi:mono/diheme cytochrome c family protein